MVTMPQDWQWNIWRVDPKTGRRMKWLGSITDPKTGFMWLDKQGKKRDHFRINNVPPASSMMQNPEREVYSTDGKTIQVGEKLPKRRIPGKYEDYTPREARKIDPVKPYKHVAPAAKAAPKPVVPDTPEMRKIKADAQKIVDRHKADEQAEIEAEKREAADG